MILEHGLVITMDPSRRILVDGAIAIRGDRIEAVGSAYDLSLAYPDLERLDLHGDLVFPGLVDTHVHTAQALLRGCADDLSLVDWLGKRVWVLQGHMTEADGRCSAELCILEMLNCTTAFVECMLVARYGFDGIAEAVQASGIRAALSKTVMDVATYAGKEQWMHPGMVEDRTTSVRQAIEAYDRWQGAADGRIQVWFGPRTPGGCTPDLYREVSRLANERRMGITIHLAEVRGDREYLLRTYGQSPAEFARDVGLLGPRSVLAHTVWLDDADMKILRETGTHVSHNPASNAKLASGIAPVAELLAAGVNVAIGCDGGPSNNTYDMLRDLRWVGYLQKARTLDPLVVPAETVLEMATLGGPRAMGLQGEIGSLEPGKKADLVVLDLCQPHLTPSPNPVSTLVYCATGADVRHVMIDGRFVVRDRRALTLNEADVLRRAQEYTADLYRRAGVQVNPSWPVQ